MLVTRICCAEVMERRQDSAQRALAGPAVGDPGPRCVGIHSLRGNDRDIHADLCQQLAGTLEHALGAQPHHRLVSAKTCAPPAGLHETVEAHSSSSEISCPGRRIPNSRNRSCKLCRCSPIVAAVREMFQRCTPSCRSKYAISNFRFASRKSFSFSPRSSPSSPPRGTTLTPCKTSSG